jgi:hypothetical protein
MALRIEKRIGAIVALSVSVAVVMAQPLTYQVRHQHLRGGATGTLRIGAESIVFTEQSKNGKHAREWAYSDIQQLSLSDAELRILTYEDQKWQLGRDRDFVFDHLPEGLVQQVYPLFTRNLDQRFIAELSEPVVHVLWQAGAKLRHGLGGSQGDLLIGDDSIIYQAKAQGESRTWRFEDIDNIATAGPFDLAITTLERSDWRHAGPTEFRFELKQALSEDRYNELWRRIYRFRSRRTDFSVASPGDTAPERDVSRSMRR